jgi:glycosyltransferase 2 family protein
VTTLIPASPAGSSGSERGAAPFGRPHGGRWIRGALVIAVAAFAAMFAFVNATKLWHILTNADPWWIAGAVLFGFGAYGAMSLSYQGIAKAAGVTMPFVEMLRITLVANTVNYLVATGGLSGFATRMYFFNRRGISAGTAVLISFVQTFLTTVTLLFFLLGGFLYLFQTHRLAGPTLVVISVLLAFLIAGAVLTALLLFHPRLRRRTLVWLANTTYWIMSRIVPQRTPPQAHISRYQSKLNRGIEFLLSRKRQMIAPVAYIFLDWVFTLLILHAAFLAVHQHVRLSIVVVGFAVGIACSFISLVPGGLGVMEGSMAAIYAGFGVSFEGAVVAVLVFRLVYYILPILVSLFFFRATFRQGRLASEALREHDVPPPG